MKKQLIVVVHGVGVKEAGVSSDLLAVSLADARLKPVSSDDFNIAEDDLYNESDKRQVYPCRVRQYADETRKRVVADFYWGDIANSKSGVLGLWISLFKTIMGLGHVIRESAAEVYREDSAGRSIASFIVKVLHGPIVAINLVMLIGVLIAWALEWATGVRGGGELSPLVIGMLAITGGWLLRGRAWSYLERLLWCWVIVTGMAVLVFQVISFILPHQGLVLLDQLKMWVGDLICSSGTSECTDAVSGIYFDGILLLMFVQLCSLLNLVLLLMLSLFFRKPDAGNNASVPGIVFPTVMVMTVMWIFFIACVWILTITPWWQLIPHKDIQNFGLRILLAVVPILVMIGVVSAIVLFKRIAWAQSLRQRWQQMDYFSEQVESVEAHRVIVNSKITGLMYVSYIFYTLLSVYILFDLANNAALNELVFFGFIASIISSASAYYDHILAFVLVSVIAITWFAYLVRDGIDVATDIITYMNDYSWESERSGTLETQTMLEKWFKLRTPPPAKSGYYNRNRIKRRLEMLVDRLVQQEAPDELYIVAHSQGTVIAMDVIEAYGQQWRKAMKPKSALGLITMGSPYAHIHNHYFPSSFPPVASLENLQPAKDGGLLDSWINIFRVDDFVGTHIDPSGIWPKEHPVPPNGHTNYWIDVNVAKILRKVLKF